MRKHLLTTCCLLFALSLSVAGQQTALTEEQIERFYGHAYLAECNDEMARMYGLR